MGVGGGKGGFVVGIDDEPCLCFRRLFNEPLFAIVYGDFIPRAPVRIIRAYLGGDFDYPVGDFSAFRQNQYMRGMVFLGVQPNIFAVCGAYKSVVLQVVPPRKYGKSIVEKFPIGSDEFLLFHPCFFLGGFEPSTGPQLRFNLC